ncbi:MAG: AlpA family phage regulatory protein [Burkholderiaceae bacterium]|nr:AlpA family phage regulatory protein [Burkholderiaceae bacterium]
MKILRMQAVKAETGHRSHASIYNAVRAGTFTKPVQIGLRAVGWPADEVSAINLARVAGMSEDQLRQLVIHLHAKRAELATAFKGEHWAQSRQREKVSVGSEVCRVDDRSGRSSSHAVSSAK